MSGCWTTVILLSRRHAGAGIPDLVTDDQGSYTTLMRPRTVSLWDMFPGALVDGDALEGLPIVGAMRTTRDEMDQVVNRLSRIADREMRSRLSAELVTWSSLNYNRDEVLDIRARLGMVTTKEVLMASPIGEEILEYGKREGRDEGRREGRLLGRREGLQLLAESRFPGLLKPVLIESLSDLGTIEALFLTIATAPDFDHARADVARLLGRN